jgi:hypothetical protein
VEISSLLSLKSKHIHQQIISHKITTGKLPEQVALMKESADEGCPFGRYCSGPALYIGFEVRRNEVLESYSWKLAADDNIDAQTTCGTLLMTYNFPQTNHPLGAQHTFGIPPVHQVNQFVCITANSPLIMAMPKLNRRMLGSFFVVAVLTKTNHLLRISGNSRRIKAISMRNAS